MNIERIQSNFQFLGHSIAELTIHNDFVAIPADGVSRTFDVRYDILSINKEENTIWGGIALFVDCHIKSIETEDEDKPSEFNLKLVLHGCFEDGKDVSEEAFSKSLSVNGCAALYSIARSIITSISAQSMIESSIVLPMINVFRLNQSDSTQDE